MNFHEAVFCLVFPTAPGALLRQLRAPLKDCNVPRADAAELNNARRGAELEDDADVKFSPHLFPDGVGGWRNAIRTSASTREGACLQTKKSNKDKDIVF